MTLTSQQPRTQVQPLSMHAAASASSPQCSLCNHPFNHWSTTLPSCWTVSSEYHQLIGQDVPYALKVQRVWCQRLDRLCESTITGIEPENHVSLSLHEIRDSMIAEDTGVHTGISAPTYRLNDRWGRPAHDLEYMRTGLYKLSIAIPLFELAEVTGSSSIEGNVFLTIGTQKILDNRRFSTHYLRLHSNHTGCCTLQGVGSFLWRHVDYPIAVQQFESEMLCRQYFARNDSVSDSLETTNGSEDTADSDGTDLTSDDGMTDVVDSTAELAIEEDNPERRNEQVASCTQQCCFRRNVH